MLSRRCLEYTPDLSRSKTTGDLCHVPLRKCDEGDPLAMQGFFEVEPVSAAWEVRKGCASTADVAGGARSKWNDSPN